MSNRLKGSGTEHWTRVVRFVPACLLAMLGLPTPCFADSTVVFNEIMYHPATSEATLEWVELHSQMGVDMDISGWSIQGGIEFTFPEGTIVEGGGFVVVAIAPVAEALGPFAGRLGNNGERLELRSNSDRLMDWVEYGDDGDWPPGADGSGVSLAKIDPDTTSHPAMNWRTSLEMGGTPGRHNFGPPTGPTQAVLLPFDAAWKFDASGVDLGTSWRTAAFDDSAWSTAEGTFYRAAGDASVAWVGGSNRTQPQDFGSSPSTNNARGASVGEIGGYLERSPAAWYADTDIGAIDLATDDLSASVTWVQNGRGNVTFGYVEAASYGLGTDPTGLYWQIDDLNLYLTVVRAGISATRELVGSLSAGVRSTITMRWTASSRTWTVTLDGGASQTAAVPDVTGLILDRFGVFSLGSSAGQGVTFWADDIEYTVGAPTSTQRFVDGEGSPVGSRTELPVGPTTYYFRTTFEFDGDSDTAELLFQPVLDDGAVAYLNGAEIYRDNLPDGVIGYSRYASSDIRVAAPSIPVSVPRDSLRNGTNVLAVEVHQSGAADDDMAFGASLVSQIEPSEPESRPALVINELPSALESDFWIELFNAASTALDLSDYVLIHAGETDGEYLFPSQTIPAGGHLLLTGDTLGFDVADDDRIFLLTSTRDALVDAAVAKDTPRARYPDTQGQWLFPSASTPGAANSFALNDAIVINEIMYHQRPILESFQSPASPYSESLEAWIELYNRGDETIDLTGWKLTDAVEFEFEPGTMMAPGEYLVVAKNQRHLQDLYPALAIAGEYSQNLSFRSDTILLTDDQGNPVDRVRYFDGGYWHALADGGGSSLELRDPRADNARPEAWGASDESQKAVWNAYSYRGVAEPILPGEPTDARGFQLGFLDGAGEVLVDDISVIRDPDGDAVELIPNGRFDGGSIGGWTFGGTHRHSYVTVDPDAADNHVLKLVGVGPTEPIFNNAFSGLADAVPDGVEYEISFRARWLTGSNQINTRLSYNRLPKTTFVGVPERGGTPGTRNSQHVANLGPTFEALIHRPVTPSAGQSVTVSVRATDPDGVVSATLWWAVNEGRWNSAAMTRQPSGHHAASIPGQDAAAIVQFYVEARDGQSATAFSPPAGPDSRALYAVYDGQAITGPVHNFRTIMLPSDATYLHDGENVRSNERLGGTVVWKERQQYYDVGVRLRGSLRPGRSEPTVGHNISFQPDRLFRGVHSTVSIDRDARSVLGVKEIVLLHAITHADGMPGMYNDIVQAIAPLPTYTSRAMLRMAAQGDVFLDSQFDNGSEGTIYESDVLRIDETNFVEFMDLGDDKEFYRWNFTIQNNRTRDDYRGLIALSKTLGMSSGAALEARAAEVMDVSEWMRVFAMQALGGVSDTYLQDGNHNLRVYQRPSDGRMLAFPWDLDGAFTVSTLPWGQGNLTKVIERTPYTRMYYGHLHDIVTTTYNVAYMSYWTRHYGELAGEDFASVLDFIADRADATESVLPPRVSFAITSNAGDDFAVDAAAAQLEGTAWIDVKEIRVREVEDPLDVTWTGLETWRAEVPLAPGTNEVILEAYDYQGQVVGNATIQITYTRSEQVEAPPGTR